MSASSGKNSVGARVWRVVLIVLVALLVLALLVEFGLRWFMSSQMTKQFDEQGAEGASVSFGATPLLFGLARGEVSEMNMDTPSTLMIDKEAKTIEGQPATKIHMEGMTMSQDPVARSLQTTTTLPTDYLLVTLQNQIAERSGQDMLGDIVMTNLTTNDAEDVVDVEFAGGLFTLTLKPEARDGALAFEATGSKLLAWDLPEEVTHQISDALSEGLKNQVAGDTMRIDRVDVGAGDITIDISGENVKLNEMGEQFGGAAPTEAPATAPANA
ncbi:DUF2993 domain-containing protein [Corynebacterium sp. SA-MJD20WY100]|uniref:LmeA family phospholipid-binding protein n=1 Tax=Corynebacterium sp. SA-MJD20WY100 TaxID=3142969 RepID=UPI0032213C4E